MVRIKLTIHLILTLWCCMLYGKAAVECHRINEDFVIRHKRLTSEEMSETDVLKGLVLEALELENNFSEMEKSGTATARYQSFNDRVNRVRLYDDDDSDERALSYLKLILRQKLIDLEDEAGFIIDLDSYASHVVRKIELRNQIIPAIEEIDDVELKNNLNQLRFKANGNYILSQYNNFVEEFSFTYFPYAACLLESLRQPNSSTAYDSLTAMTSAFTNRLNESKQYIEDIKSNSRDVTYMGGNEKEDAFYIWKNADVRDKIRQLFKGEKITLLADVKANQLNAVKFNKLDFVFRTSNRTVTKQLDRSLKAFGIRLYHSGRSSYRIQDKFYQLISPPMRIFFNYEKNGRHVPVSYNGVYSKLRDNRAVLSPFTEWELQLVDLVRGRFQRLTPFEQLDDIDIELHGRGSYVEDNLPICEKDNLSRFYSQMEN